MLDILILRKEEPEIRIPLCKKICSLQLSLVMSARNLVCGIHKIFTSVLFSLPQVLYVLAEGTLNPSDICYLAHFCNRSSGSRPPPPPLPSLLEETWSKRHSNSPPPPRPSLATLQGKPLRHDPAAWSATARTKKKREGDPIVFLQLSDIHLDQLFAEVGIYPCGSHGNFISLSLSSARGPPVSATSTSVVVHGIMAQ